MGVANPLNKAYATLEKIDTQLSSISLDDLFPDITNPLIPMGLGLPFTTPGGDINSLSSLNTPAISPNVFTNQGGNVNYNQLTKFANFMREFTIISLLLLS